MCNIEIKSIFDRLCGEAKLSGAWSLNAQFPTISRSSPSDSRRTIVEYFAAKLENNLAKWLKNHLAVREVRRGSFFRLLGWCMAEWWWGMSGHKKQWNKELRVKRWNVFDREMGDKSVVQLRLREALGLCECLFSRIKLEISFLFYSTSSRCLCLLSNLSRYVSHFAHS